MTFSQAAETFKFQSPKDHLCTRLASCLDGSTDHELSGLLADLTDAIDNSKPLIAIRTLLRTGKVPWHQYLRGSMALKSKICEKIALLRPSVLLYLASCIGDNLPEEHDITANEIFDAISKIALKAL